MNMLAGLLSAGPCGLAARPPAWWDAWARQCPGTSPPLGGGGLGATLRHVAPGLKLGGLVNCKLAERLCRERTSNQPGWLDRCNCLVLSCHTPLPGSSLMRRRAGVWAGSQCLLHLRRAARRPHEAVAAPVQALQGRLAHRPPLPHAASAHAQPGKWRAVGTLVTRHCSGTPSKGVSNRT